ncbi:MAG: biopolymer transport protein ExbD [Kiritimatiellia bacterium]|jgi:biopolymer transport protein ExbD
MQLPENARDDEVDMAPMIDMVFLLLIFFMVTSSQKQMEKITIDVPIASNAKMEKKPIHRQNVTVDKDGQVWLGTEKYELERMTERIKDLKLRLPDLKIFLRADAGVRHEHVRDVMKGCASVGASEIIFATFEKDPAAPK